MRMWVFNVQTLHDALVAYEAERQRQGASEQQAKDDTAAIVAFLQSAAVTARKMVIDDGRRW